MLQQRQKTQSLPDEYLNSFIHTIYVYIVCIKVFVNDAYIYKYCVYINNVCMYCMYCMYRMYCMSMYVDI